MYRSIPLATSICLVAILGVESQADQADVASVVLSTTLTVEGPRGSSQLSNTLIAPLDRSDTQHLEIRSYTIDLAITDRRLNEFSIQLSVKGDDGTVIDSSTVLVRADREATFKFKSGDDLISGIIRLRQIIEPRKE